MHMAPTCTCSQTSATRRSAACGHVGPDAQETVSTDPIQTTIYDDRCTPKILDVRSPIAQLQLHRKALAMWHTLCASIMVTVCFAQGAFLAAGAKPCNSTSAVPPCKCTRSTLVS